MRLMQTTIMRTRMSLPPHSRWQKMVRYKLLCPTFCLVYLPQCIADCHVTTQVKEQSLHICRQSSSQCRGK